jgi:hypothetical protein
MVVIDYMDSGFRKQVSQASKRLLARDGPREGARQARWDLPDREMSQVKFGVSKKKARKSGPSIAGTRLLLSADIPFALVTA